MYILEKKTNLKYFKVEEKIKNLMENVTLVSDLASTTLR